LHLDPEQLNNVAFTLSETQKEEYRRRIIHLQRCSGKECHHTGTSHHH